MIKMGPRKSNRNTLRRRSSLLWAILYGYGIKLGKIYEKIVGIAFLT